MAIDPYTSDDYAAFLAYAGAPPLESSRRRKYPDRTSKLLKARLEYIGKCDVFCQEYFKSRLRYESSEEWVEFYQAFTRWFTIWEGMADEIDGEKNYGIGT